MCVCVFMCECIYVCMRMWVCLLHTGVCHAAKVNVHNIMVTKHHSSMLLTFPKHNILAFQHKWGRQHNKFASTVKFYEIVVKLGKRVWPSSILSCGKDDG